MTPTAALQATGQRIWLDHINRALLGSGTLKRYIDELGVTGLTSNPTIFMQAITRSTDYDESIRRAALPGVAAESALFALIVEDLAAAALQFRSIYNASKGLDGWVSLEVSPLLAADATRTLQQALQMRALVVQPNVMIKIPGTEAGVAAIEEAIFAGIPVNVTLLFSREQYLAATGAYLRGIERRVAAGLDPHVASVASVFISRWDQAVIARFPQEYLGRLGIAMAGRIYRAYGEWQASPRWQRLAALGALPQRLLWASTGTKDARSPDTLYVQALAAPGTVDTLPEKTLLAFADHGVVPGVMAVDGGDAEAVLAEFSRGGVDLERTAVQLQQEGADAFVKAWQELIACVETKATR